MKLSCRRCLKSLIWESCWDHRHSDKCRSLDAGPLAPLALSPITSLTSLGAASWRAAFYYHDRRPPSGWMRQHICREIWRRAQHAPVLKWNVPWWILGNVFSQHWIFLNLCRYGIWQKLGRQTDFALKTCMHFVATVRRDYPWSSVLSRPCCILSCSRHLLKKHVSWTGYLLTWERERASDRSTNRQFSVSHSESCLSSLIRLATEVWKIQFRWDVNCWPENMGSSWSREVDEHSRRCTETC